MNIINELESVGSIYTDKHFVYASGKHGSGYINMDPLFTQTELGKQLGKELVKPFMGKFDTVVGPATGGIIVASWVANVASGANHPIATVWADKVGGGQFDFERDGFKEQIQGKKVLVVEDLLTTGGSVDKVIRKIEEYGGETIGLSVICNRGGVKAEDLKIPKLESLTSVNFTAEDANSCSLCNEQAPIVEDIGHGESYKKEHPEYKGGYIKLLN